MHLKQSQSELVKQRATFQQKWTPAERAERRLIAEAKQRWLCQLLENSLACQASKKNSQLVAQAS